MIWAFTHKYRNMRELRLQNPLRWIAFFIVFSISYALVSTEAQAQNYRFTDVQIEGATRVEAGTILTYAGITQGELVSGGQLNAAYQNVLGSGLFETVEFIPSGNTLIIRVREYPTINRINFEGNRRLDNDELGALVQSQVRRVFSPSLAEQDASRIVQAYELQGRLAANVDPVIIRRSNNRVDLVFEVKEGRVAEVERISFVGNRNYGDRRLRRVLESKQAGLFRRIVQRDTFVGDRVDFDRQVLRDFYLSRGYVDFEVLSAAPEFSRERDAFFVTFNVREGQQFSFGEITTTSELSNVDPDEFHKEIRIRPGQVYSPNGVDNTIARLERLAIQKEMDFVRVEPRITRNDRTLTLDVEFVVVRGERLFVERIDIEGNATTLDRVVRRQFTSVEGDPFNPRSIRDSAERIRALGFFSKADVEAREGSSSDSVVIDVDVEEQPTGSLGFGGSYSRNSGFGANVSFEERNFLGRGQRLSFEVSTTADTGSYAFGFSEPSFLGRDVEFFVNGNYQQSNSASNTRFSATTGGGNVGFEFPLTEFSRLSLNYFLEGVDITSVAVGSSSIIKAEGLGRMSFSSGLGYEFSFSTLDKGLNPDAGVLLRFGQDFAGVGGDNEFVRTTALGVAERKFRRGDITVRAIGEAGAHISLNGGISKTTDRFTLSRKMRGFEPFGLGPRDLTAANLDALGGNYFAIAKVEAEFPLGLPEEYGIHGGVFLDVGSVWGLDSTAGSGGPVDDSFKPRVSAGFSVFWETPIGPLRFNFSRALQKESYDRTQNFDFTISTRF